MNITTIHKFLFRNKWLLLFVLWQTLWIVVFSFFVADADDRKNLLLYNSLYVGVLVLVMPFTSDWIRKTALVLLLIASTGPNLIEWGWFMIDQTILIRNQFWVVFATNPAETRGFLSIVTWWQWIVQIVCLGISGCLFLKAWKETESHINYWFNAGAIVVLLGLTLWRPIRNNVPCIDFYCSFHGYCVDLRKAEQFTTNRQNLSNEVRFAGENSPSTIVVVIGESVGRHHCSLYDYPRPTNPLLTQRRDLVVYDDVVSPDFMTQVVLQQVLTFANYENPDARWSEPTLPELLRAAGWKTWWYEHYGGRNNTSSTIPTSFTSIARMNTIYEVNGEDEALDEAVLPKLHAVLSDTTTTRKGVFFHLFGNHFPYKNRYPDRFEHFSDEDICSPYVNQLNARQKSVINEYDNAVRYNDWVVDSLLNMLVQAEGANAMLYFPDHGEEMFDYMCYAGRSFDKITRNLCEIPCIFWQNEAFRQTRSLYINPKVPYCTDDMIHSLLDLFGVEYQMKDTCRSMFHKGFAPKKRMMAGKEYSTLPENNDKPDNNIGMVQEK